MHAFLSKIFGRTKKDEKKDEETSPTTLSPTQLLDGKFEAVSPTVSPSASKFLELDQTNVEHDKGVANAKATTRPVSSEGKSSKLDTLPHLSLNFGESRTDSFLLDDEIQGLSDSLIGEHRLNPLEALILIRSCSQAITAHGLETLGLMHPHWYSSSPEIQRKLISRFLHSQSIKNANDTATTTFDSAIESTRSMHDIAAVLRWGLRHLQLDGDTFGTDAGWYKAFLDAEAAAEYPPKAFSEKLAPMIPIAHLELLTTTLELFSSLAAHSEANSTSGSKLSKLFGIWLLSARQIEDKDDWFSFYARWERAGRQLEHLFLARIRDTNEDQRMPVRLLELVRKYPYTQGLSSPQTDLQLLPRPRLSTPIYDALYVRIEIEFPPSARKPKTKMHPLNLLADAFATKVTTGEYAELWTKITAASENGDTPSPLSNIFADETIRFLSFIPDSNKGKEAKSPAFSLLQSPSSPSARSLASVEADVQAATQASSSHKKFATEPITPLTASALGNNWEQFSSSGFLDSTPAIAPLVATLFDQDIEKTVPPEPSAALSRKSSKRVKAISRKSVDLSRSSPKDKEVTYFPAPTEAGPNEINPVVRAARLEIIQFDEAFIDFWTDSLLDPITAKWPTFIICKFKSTLVPGLTYGTPPDENQQQKQLKWLVLEQVYTNAKPPPPIMLPTPDATPMTSPIEQARAVSPTPSTKKRFNFWSMSRSTSSTSTGSANGKKKAPVGKVNEMGELVEEESAEQVKNKYVAQTTKAEPVKKVVERVPVPAVGMKDSSTVPVAAAAAAVAATAVAATAVAAVAVGADAETAVPTDEDKTPTQEITSPVQGEVSTTEAATDATVPVAEGVHTEAVAQSETPTAEIVSVPPIAESELAAAPTEASVAPAPDVAASVIHEPAVSAASAEPTQDAVESKVVESAAPPAEFTDTPAVETVPVVEQVSAAPSNDAETTSTPIVETEAGLPIVEEVQAEAAPFVETPTVEEPEVAPAPVVEPTDTSIVDTVSVVEVSPVVEKALPAPALEAERTTGPIIETEAAAPKAEDTNTLPTTAEEAVAAVEAEAAGPGIEAEDSLPVPEEQLTSFTAGAEVAAPVEPETPIAPSASGEAGLNAAPFVEADSAPVPRAAYIETEAPALPIADIASPAGELDAATPTPEQAMKDVDTQAEGESDVSVVQVAALTPIAAEAALPIVQAEGTTSADNDDISPAQAEVQTVVPIEPAPAIVVSDDEATPIEPKADTASAAELEASSVDGAAEAEINMEPAAVVPGLISSPTERDFASAVDDEAFIPASEPTVPPVVEAEAEGSPSLETEAVVDPVAEAFIPHPIAEAVTSIPDVQVQSSTVALEPESVQFAEKAHVVAAVSDADAVPSGIVAEASPALERELLPSTVVDAGVPSPTIAADSLRPVMEESSALEVVNTADASEGGEPILPLGSARIHHQRSVAPSHLLSDPAFSPDLHSNPYFASNREPAWAISPSASHPVFKNKEQAESLSATTEGEEVSTTHQDAVASVIEAESAILVTGDKEALAVDETTPKVEHIETVHAVADEDLVPPVKTQFDVPGVVVQKSGPSAVADEPISPPPEDVPSVVRETPVLDVEAKADAESTQVITAADSIPLANTPPYPTTVDVDVSPAAVFDTVPSTVADSESITASSNIDVPAESASHAHPLAAETASMSPVEPMESGVIPPPVESVTLTNESEVSPAEAESQVAQPIASLHDPVLAPVGDSEIAHAAAESVIVVSSVESPSPEDIHVPMSTDHLKTTSQPAPAYTEERPAEHIHQEATAFSAPGVEGQASSSTFEAEHANDVPLALISDVVASYENRSTEADDADATSQPQIEEDRSTVVGELATSKQTSASEQLIGATSVMEPTSDTPALAGKDAGELQAHLGVAESEVAERKEEDEQAAQEPMADIGPENAGASKTADLVAEGTVRVPESEPVLPPGLYPTAAQAESHSDALSASEDVPSPEAIEATAATGDPIVPANMPEVVEGIATNDQHTPEIRSATPTNEGTAGESTTAPGESISAISPSTPSPNEISAPTATEQEAPVLDVTTAALDGPVAALSTEASQDTLTAPADITPTKDDDKDVAEIADTPLSSAGAGVAAVHTERAANVEHIGERVPAVREANTGNFAEVVLPSASGAALVSAVHELSGPAVVPDTTKKDETLADIADEPLLDKSTSDELGTKPSDVMETEHVSDSVLVSEPVVVKEDEHSVETVPMTAAALLEEPVDTLAKSNSLDTSAIANILPETIVLQSTQHSVEAGPAAEAMDDASAETVTSLTEQQEVNGPAVPLTESQPSVEHEIEEGAQVAEPEVVNATTPVSGDVHVDKESISLNAEPGVIHNNTVADPSLDNLSDEPRANVSLAEESAIDLQVDAPAATAEPEALIEPSKSLVFEAESVAAPEALVTAEDSPAHVARQIIGETVEPIQATVASEEPTAQPDIEVGVEPVAPPEAPIVSEEIIADGTTEETVHITEEASEVAAHVNEPASGKEPLLMDSVVEVPTDAPSAAPPIVEAGAEHAPEPTEPVASVEMSADAAEFAAPVEEASRDTIVKTPAIEETGMSEKTSESPANVEPEERASIPPAIVVDEPTPFDGGINAALEEAAHPEAFSLSTDEAVAPLESAALNGAPAAAEDIEVSTASVAGPSELPIESVDEPAITEESFTEGASSIEASEANTVDDVTTGLVAEVKPEGLGLAESIAPIDKPTALPDADVPLAEVVVSPAQAEVVGEAETVDPSGAGGNAVNLVTPVELEAARADAVVEFSSDEHVQEVNATPSAADVPPAQKEVSLAEESTGPTEDASLPSEPLIETVEESVLAEEPAKVDEQNIHHVPVVAGAEHMEHEDVPPPVHENGNESSEPIVSKSVVTEPTARDAEPVEEPATPIEPATVSEKTSISEHIAHVVVEPEQAIEREDSNNPEEIITQGGEAIEAPIQKVEAVPLEDVVAMAKSSSNEVEHEAEVAGVPELAAKSALSVEGVPENFAIEEDAPASKAAPATEDVSNKVVHEIPVPVPAHDESTIVGEVSIPVEVTPAPVAPSTGDKSSDTLAEREDTVEEASNPKDIPVVAHEESGAMEETAALLNVSTLPIASSPDDVEVPNHSNEQNLEEAAKIEISAESYEGVHLLEATTIAEAVTASAAEDSATPIDDSEDKAAQQAPADESTVPENLSSAAPELTEVHAADFEEVVGADPAKILDINAVEENGSLAAHTERALDNVEDEEDRPVLAEQASVLPTDAITAPAEGAESEAPVQPAQDEADSVQVIDAPVEENAAQLPKDAETTSSVEAIPTHVPENSSEHLIPVEAHVEPAAEADATPTTPVTYQTQTEETRSLTKPILDVPQDTQAEEADELANKSTETPQVATPERVDSEEDSKEPIVDASPLKRGHREPTSSHETAAATELSASETIEKPDEEPSGTMIFSEEHIEKVTALPAAEESVAPSAENIVEEALAAQLPAEVVIESTLPAHAEPAEALAVPEVDDATMEDSDAPAAADSESTGAKVVETPMPEEAKEKERAIEPSESLITAEPVSEVSDGPPPTTLVPADMEEGATAEPMTAGVVRDYVAEPSTVEQGEHVESMQEPMQEPIVADEVSFTDAAPEQTNAEPAIPVADNEIAPAEAEVIPEPIESTTTTEHPPEAEPIYGNALSDTAPVAANAAMGSQSETDIVAIDKEKKAATEPTAQPTMQDEVPEPPAAKEDDATDAADPAVMDEVTAPVEAGNVAKAVDSTTEGPDDANVTPDAEPAVEVDVPEAPVADQGQENIVVAALPESDVATEPEADSSTEITSVEPEAAATESAPTTEKDEDPTALKEADTVPEAAFATDPVHHATAAPVPAKEDIAADPLAVPAVEDTAVPMPDETVTEPEVLNGEYSTKDELPSEVAQDNVAVEEQAEVVQEEAKLLTETDVAVNEPEPQAEETQRHIVEPPALETTSDESVEVDAPIAVADGPVVAVPEATEHLAKEVEAVVPVVGDQVAPIQGSTEETEVPTEVQEKREAVQEDVSVHHADVIEQEPSIPSEEHREAQEDAESSLIAKVSESAEEQPAEHLLRPASAIGALTNEEPFPAGPSEETEHSTNESSSDVAAASTTVEAEIETAVIPPLPDSVIPEVSKEPTAASVVDNQSASANVIETPEADPHDDAHIAKEAIEQVPKEPSEEGPVAPEPQSVEIDGEVVAEPVAASVVEEQTPIPESLQIADVADHPDPADQLVIDDTEAAEQIVQPSLSDATEATTAPAENVSVSSDHVEKLAEKPSSASELSTSKPDEGEFADAAEWNVLEEKTMENDSAVQEELAAASPVEESVGALAALSELKSGVEPSELSTSVHEPAAPTEPISSSGEAPIDEGSVHIAAGAEAITADAPTRGDSGAIEQVNAATEASAEDPFVDTSAHKPVTLTSAAEAEHVPELTKPADAVEVPVEAITPTDSVDEAPHEITAEMPAIEEDVAGKLESTVAETQAPTDLPSAHVLDSEQGLTAADETVRLSVALHSESIEAAAAPLQNAATTDVPAPALNTEASTVAASLPAEPPFERGDRPGAAEEQLIEKTTVQTPVADAVEDNTATPDAAVEFEHLARKIDAPVAGEEPVFPVESAPEIESTEDEAADFPVPDVKVAPAADVIASREVEPKAQTEAVPEATATGDFSVESVDNAHDSNVLIENGNEHHKESDNLDAGHDKSESVVLPDKEDAIDEESSFDVTPALNGNGHVKTETEITLVEPTSVPSVEDDKLEKILAQVDEEKLTIAEAPAAEPSAIQDDSVLPTESVLSKVEELLTTAGSALNVESIAKSLHPSTITHEEPAMNLTTTAANDGDDEQ